MTSLITTIHPRASAPRNPDAARAMAQLEAELLAFERGVEPKNDRVQHALLELSTLPLRTTSDAARRLCGNLCMYLQDIDQDEKELCIEDLDVLLESYAQLGDLIFSRVEREHQCHQERVGAVANQRSIQLPDAPEVWSSGLLVASLPDETRVVFPSMDNKLVTAEVLADVSELWERTPVGLDWTLEFGRSERVPASLLALLVDLGEGHSGQRRRVLLQGLPELHSLRLTECMQRYFVLEN